MATLAEVERQRLQMQEQLDAQKNAAERNRAGQFATPPALALDIATYLWGAWQQTLQRVRFLDPAIGTGSFYSALRQVIPSESFEHACGIEIDPRFAETARSFWGKLGLEVLEGDFSGSTCRTLCGPAAFSGWPDRAVTSLSMFPGSKWSMKKLFANSAASRPRSRPRGRKENRTMPERVTYGQLRDVLLSLGFEEPRRGQGIGLEHPDSDTLFLFRPYKESDRVQPAEVFHVRELLDARALLAADSFNCLLTRAPA